jgi:hypothetical protein
VRGPRKSSFVCGGAVTSEENIMSEEGEQLPLRRAREILFV